MTAPLRRVLGDVVVAVNTTRADAPALVGRELLECGHLLLVREDHYGRTTATRRRCRRCEKGEEADPRWIAEAARRLAALKAPG